MATNTSEYWASYYARNKARLLEKKRKKYSEDQDYRDRVKQSSRDRYAEEVEEKEGRKVYSFGVPSETSSSIINGHDGQTYFSIRYASVIAKVSVSTLRRWIRDGVLPPPRQESEGRGWRWFSAAQLHIMRKFSNYKNLTSKEKIALRVWAEQHWWDSGGIQWLKRESSGSKRKVVVRKKPAPAPRRA